MSTFTRTRFSLVFAAAAAASLASPAWMRADTLPDAAPENAGQAFTREQVVAGLTRALVSHFNLEGDLQIELLRAWAVPARTALVWDLDVVEFPPVATSSMMLRTRILADGAPHAEVNIVIRAQLWRDAWATRQPVALGAGFDAAVLETRRVDLFRDREALPASVGDRSYIYARAVSAGRMLTWRDVARRPLVRKGDLIEVSATDGPLIVTMKALAMENGAQGDTITVRNPESRKNFSALVIDESRVQVRF
ncbi:MAG: flagellar basal body P-ring formation chaperone FlgA [Opitutaceae bacterium]|nr:flagellar basal body P-ring formation chaperone FlgA [Opitutaceae bacterium]